MLVHEGCRRAEEGAELREMLCFENDMGDARWAAGWARVTLGDHSEPGRQDRDHQEHGAHASPGVRGMAREEAIQGKTEQV